MSFTAFSWVLDHAKVSGSEYLTLLMLADEASDDGLNCFPSFARLAEKTRLSVGGVRRCLDSLEKQGEIVVRRPIKQKRGNHNNYGLVMGRPVAQVAEMLEKTTKKLTFEGVINVPECALQSARYDDDQCASQSAHSVIAMRVPERALVEECASQSAHCDAPSNADLSDSTRANARSRSAQTLSTLTSSIEESHRVEDEEAFDLASLDTNAVLVEETAPRSERPRNEVFDAIKAHLGDPESNAQDGLIGAAAADCRKAGLNAEQVEALIVVIGSRNRRGKTIANLKKIASTPKHPDVEQARSLAEVMRTACNIALSAERAARESGGSFKFKLDSADELAVVLAQLMVGGFSKDALKAALKVDKAPWTTRGLRIAIESPEYFTQGPGAATHGGSVAAAPKPSYHEKLPPGAMFAEPERTPAAYEHLENAKAAVHRRAS